MLFPPPQNVVSAFTNWATELLNMEDSISFAFTSIEEIPEDAIEAICKGNVRRLDFTECQLR